MRERTRRGSAGHSCGAPQAGQAAYFSRSPLNLNLSMKEVGDHTWKGVKMMGRCGDNGFRVYEAYDVCPCL